MSYESGLWYVVCDACGREFKSNELRKRWDGLMVCDGDYEPRHPQDFVRGVADKQTVPYSRPEQADQFINVCTPVTSQGIADYGTADCARADVYNNFLPVCTFEGNSATAGFAVAGCSIAGIPYPGT